VRHRNSFCLRPANGDCDLAGSIASLKRALDALNANEYGMMGNDGTFAGWQQIGGSDTNYSVAGIGDFNGNGISDILYRSDATGDTWYDAIGAGWSLG
jgi:hypothetical protein